jgi:Tfp pilus assembly protein PilX
MPVNIEENRPKDTEMTDQTEINGECESRRDGAVQWDKVAHTVTRVSRKRCTHEIKQLARDVIALESAPDHPLMDAICH